MRSFFIHPVRLQRLREDCVLSACVCMYISESVRGCVKCGTYMDINALLVLHIYVHQRRRNPLYMHHTVWFKGTVMDFGRSLKQHIQTNTTPSFSVLSKPMPPEHMSKLEP